MRVAKVADSLRLLRARGPQFGAVIDVGIQHATPVLIDLFPGLHHYLFEPVAEYYPRIRQNYAAIAHDLVEAAVADEDGTLTLRTQKKTRGDEISHAFLVRGAPSGTDSRQVRTLTLDSYFRHEATGPRGPYLLKIDVEGADVPRRILDGARETLADTAAVMIEMTVDRFMERARALDDAGFDLWDLCDLCYYGDCLWQADAVFLRREVKAAHPDLMPMHQTPFRPDLWQSGF